MLDNSFIFLNVDSASPSMELKSPADSISSPSDEYTPIKREAGWGDRFELEEFSWSLSGKGYDPHPTDSDGPGERGHAEKR